MRSWVRKMMLALGADPSMILHVLVVVITVYLIRGSEFQYTFVLKPNISVKYLLSIEHTGMKY